MEDEAVETQPNAQAPAPMVATLILPPIWTNRSHHWFSMVEAKFKLAYPPITREETKFNYVMTVLTPEIADEVSDIITNPDPVAPYTKLKEALINRTSLSESQRLKQLLSGAELGNRKPTQLLRQMRHLVKDTGYVNDTVLRELFLQHMPQSSQAILVKMLTLRNYPQRLCTAIVYQSQRRSRFWRSDTPRTWKRDYLQTAKEIAELPVFDYGESDKLYRRVFVWGNVEMGALGVPYYKGRTSTMRKQYDIPSRMRFAERFKVKNASCGYGFTALVVDDGKADKLYGCGLNADSQLGYHAMRPGRPLGIILFPVPVALPFVRPHCGRIHKVSAGRAHLAVVTNEGLFTLGSNVYGQCGRHIHDNENYAMNRRATHYRSFDGDGEQSGKIVDVVCGQDHTVALTSQGHVYSCGWSADGQTGLNTFANVARFRRVGGDLRSERIVKVAGRSDFVMALSAEGQVFGWGNTEYGQMLASGGSEGEQQVALPQHMPQLNDICGGRIIDVAAAGSYCLALNEAGEVFTWGYGVLGVGPELRHSLKPVKIPDTLFGRNAYQTEQRVVQLVSGMTHSAAVTNTGDLFMWGRNTKRCLGLLGDTDQYFPLKVPLCGSVEQVAMGVDHTIAVCRPYI